MADSTPLVARRTEAGWHGGFPTFEMECPRTPSRSLIHESSHPPSDAIVVSGVLSFRRERRCIRAKPYISAPHQLIRRSVQRSGVQRSGECGGQSHSSRTAENRSSRESNGSNQHSLKDGNMETSTRGVKAMAHDEPRLNLTYAHIRDRVNRIARVSHRRVEAPRAPSLGGTTWLRTSPTKI